MKIGAQIGLISLVLILCGCAHAGRFHGDFIGVTKELEFTNRQGKNVNGVGIRVERGANVRAVGRGMVYLPFTNVDAVIIDKQSFLISSNKIPLGVRVVITGTMETSRPLSKKDGSLLREVGSSNSFPMCIKFEKIKVIP